jgi:hypothetical protein
MAQSHYLYEIKNNLNGKIYIGIHSTENISDGYMGSGTLITKAIQKYGRSNFTKTILKYCDSRELLIELEKKVVNQNFIDREDTYNLTIGGSSINSTWRKSNETIAYKLKNDPIWAETRSRNISLGLTKAIKSGRCSTATREFQMIRNKKSLSEESIKKRKSTYAKNKYQQGENHNLYGKKIVNDGIIWKWISKEEVEKYLESGWKLGKVNFNKEI